MKTFNDLMSTLIEAKATYCGRCGTTHVPPSKGGTCPALKNEDAMVEAGGDAPAKHRVTVTISDPNHEMVSKRKEQMMKTIRLSANDERHAIERATAHYKKQGYRVHGAEHLGMVTEAAMGVDPVSHKTYMKGGVPQSGRNVERHKFAITATVRGRGGKEETIDQESHAHGTKDEAEAKLRDHFTNRLGYKISSMKHLGVVKEDINLDETGEHTDIQNMAEGSKEDFENWKKTIALKAAQSAIQKAANVRAQKQALAKSTTQNDINRALAQKGVAEGSEIARANKLGKAPKPKNQQEYDAIEKYRKDLAQSYKPNKEQGVSEGQLDEISAKLAQAVADKRGSNAATYRAGLAATGVDQDAITKYPPWKKMSYKALKSQQAATQRLNKERGVMEGLGNVKPITPAAKRYHEKNKWILNGNILGAAKQHYDMIQKLNQKGQKSLAEGKDIENYHHTGPGADKKAQAHAKRLGPDWAAYRHPSAAKWDNLHIVVKKNEAPKDLQSLAEGHGDDRGDYRSTAQAAEQASRDAKNKQAHANAADLHDKAATYAMSAGRDASVVQDHQMMAQYHRSKMSSTSKAKHTVKEDAEQLDELSKDTLVSYAQKARKETEQHARTASRTKSPEKAKMAYGQLRKRMSGLTAATDKLGKGTYSEQLELDEDLSEQLDEMRRNREDDEGWGNPAQYRMKTATRHAVTINGRNWKLFHTPDEAQRVAKAVSAKYPDKKVGTRPHQVYV